MSFEVAVSRRVGERVIAARFSAGPGVTALFGPSGAGKTSILNMIAGLLRPDEGRIVVDGQILFDAAHDIDLPPERRRLGYVFQDGRLFPHQRVRYNLLYGHRPEPGDSPLPTLAETTRFLGIGHLLDRWPRSLSGGEAQRVAIGRALLSGPRFLLMDEPLASLDTPRREEILAVIARIAGELAVPILYVTHDAREIERLKATVVPVE